MPFRSRPEIKLSGERVNDGHRQDPKPFPTLASFSIISPPNPRLIRPIKDEFTLIRLAQPERVRWRAFQPLLLRFGRQNDRHAVVNALHRFRGIGNHHRIDPPPFVAVAPDTGAGEQVFARNR